MATKPMTMLERLKAEKARLETQTGGNFEQVPWFKPAMGDNTIRIIPDIDPEKEPWVTVQLHYINVKKKDGTVAKGVPVRCYHELGEDNCPLCKYAQKLMKSSDETDIEAGKRYRAKEVYLYNIIDFATKTVVPYSVGKQIHEAIVGYICDFQDEDLLSLEGGKNWKVIKKQKSKGAKSAFNVEYVVRLDIKSSAVPAKMIAQVDEEAMDLTALYQNKEETIVKAFLGFADTEEEEEEDVAPAPRGRAASRSAAPARRAPEPEPEEEEEEPTPPPSRRAAAKPAATPSRRAAAPVEEEEEEAPAPTRRSAAPASRTAAAKPAAKPVAKPAAKAKPVIEDEDLDLEDMGEYDDVDAELDSMGI